MLFLKEIYLAGIFIGLWQTNSKQPDSVYLVISVMIISFLTFIIQQYYIFIKCQTLDIRSFKQLQKLVELDNKQMFSKIYKHVKKVLIYIQNEDSRILLTQAFLYNFGNCEIFSPKFARVCINDKNSYQRLWITDSEVERIFSSCIIKRQISPLIKDIVLSQNKQQAYQTAQALTKSGNFIHFYNQIISYQHDDNDQQNEYNYTQTYFQIVKQFEQQNLSFTAFYKHIINYLITNPQLVLYDLYD
ncbi:hypothetical protein ABPG74_007604 [Tetrahymena malaccensis]